ncbi:unnamed protein product [Rhizophagus irregularis]|nr:unnamed protein product [Rhizophagus irregularis]
MRFIQHRRRLFLDNWTRRTSGLKVCKRSLCYGNKFTLQGNSHVSNCCHKVFGVWTRRKLDFFRRIGFQILTAASIFFTQDLESSFFVSLIVLIIKSKR